MEKSVDVYVDSTTTHNPIITRGIHCKDLGEGGWCDECWQCIKEYGTYTVQVDAYDPDGDPLTYTWVCRSGWLIHNYGYYKRVTTAEDFICYQAPEALPPRERDEDYEFIDVTVKDPVGGSDYSHVVPDIYPSGTSCLCGDANKDGVVGAGDVTYLISYLFRGGPPPQDPIERGDANNDCEVSGADVNYLLEYLYRHGNPPECCWLQEWSE